MSSMRNEFPDMGGFTGENGKEGSVGKDRPKMKPESAMLRVRLGGSLASGSYLYSSEDT